jgi:hypothetical protein
MFEISYLGIILHECGRMLAAGSFKPEVYHFISNPVFALSWPYPSVFPRPSRGIVVLHAHWLDVGMRLACAISSCMQFNLTGAARSTVDAD